MWNSCRSASCLWYSVLWLKNQTTNRPTDHPSWSLSLSLSVSREREMPPDDTKKKTEEAMNKYIDTILCVFVWKYEMCGTIKMYISTHPCSSMCGLSAAVHHVLSGQIHYWIKVQPRRLMILHARTGTNHCTLPLFWLYANEIFSSLFTGPMPFKWLCVCVCVPYE